MSATARSYVVTGAGRGVGRAIAERLAGRGHVIALDRDAEALAWTAGRSAIEGLAGDGADERALGAAVDLASQAGTLAGWVNNAAVFGDAALHDTPVDDELGRLHPLGRAGRADEAAAVVEHLLSSDASFVNGAVLPVDGGRAALGQDPEAREVTGLNR